MSVSRESSVILREKNSNLFMLESSLSAQVFHMKAVLMDEMLIGIVRSETEAERRCDTERHR